MDPEISDTEYTSSRDPTCHTTWCTSLVHVPGARPFLWCQCRGRQGGPSLSPSLEAFRQHLCGLRGSWCPSQHEVPATSDQLTVRAETKSKMEASLEDECRSASAASAAAPIIFRSLQRRNSVSELLAEDKRENEKSHVMACVST